MKSTRRKHAAAFKAKVALEAAKQLKTIPALASEFEVHPTQVKNWKDKLEKDAGLVFTELDTRESQEKDNLIEGLYKQIGKLTVQNDWLKKKMGLRDE